MKLVVIGSRDWNDYNTFMRKMTVEIEDWRISSPDDVQLTIMHIGRREGIEDFVSEYVGKIEDLLRQKGVKISERILRFDSPKIFDKDFQMLNDGIDKLIIFQKGSCQRSLNAARIASVIGIPTTIVKE
jgi:hypothetical protein